MASEEIKSSADDEKIPDRDPYPDEIETEEEKNHPLKKYEDIKEKLEEIRQLHLDGTLFDAEEKSKELIQYIKDKYESDSESLLKEYEQHPRKKLIDNQLIETAKMLEFMTSDKGWDIFKDDGTWQTEWQPSDDSEFESFRITGVGDVPLYNILAVIYEMDLIKTWMPLCKESTECGQLSLHSKCGLIRIGLFWPIQDRETILFGYGVDDLKNGKILIYFDSRDDNPNVNIPECPKGRCRVDVFVGGFFFERLTENTTKITVVWNCDPKMSVPTSIINWFAGTFAGTLVSQIVKAAKFDETSEYYKRIQNNPEFYGMIKKKLAENKTMSDLKAVISDNDDNKEQEKGQEDVVVEQTDENNKE